MQQRVETITPIIEFGLLVVLNYGKRKLDYVMSVSSPYPVIATTSKLLSTGADCKRTKLIVLNEMIGSMTELKQIYWAWDKSLLGARW